MLPNNPVVPLWAHCLGIYWPACHGSAPLTQQSPEMNSAAQIRAGSESLLLFGILEVIGYFQAWPFKKKKNLVLCLWVTVDKTMLLDSKRPKFGMSQTTWAHRITVYYPT